jgi:methylmalonyl-CoA mutase cobalamin-binding subunit
MKNKIFQPGAILHEVIVGAFRAKGTSFDAWCTQNGVNRSTARLATYGQSGGDNGKRLLGKIIRDAGAEVVEIAYRQRMEAEVAKLAKGKAVAA